MEEKVKKVIQLLAKQNKTLATMESCTGGGLVNAITNIEGASEVISFSAITYSNEYKIKMGVDKNVIAKYTVYSQKTANEMSKNIALFTNSNYGIGITGKLNRLDRKNPYGDDNIVYISIYNRNKNIYYSKELTVRKTSRKENKAIVINQVFDMMIEILNND